MFTGESRRRLGGLILAVVVLASSLGTALIPLPAQAVTPAACAAGGNYKPTGGGDCTPGDEATSYSYYVALSGCVQHNMGQGGSANFPVKVSENGDATTAEMFDDNQAFGYVYPGGVKTDCKDIMSKALALWGWNGNTQTFLEAMGNTYKVDTAAGTAQYIGVSDEAARLKNFQKAVQKQVYGNAAPTLSAAAIYDIDFDGFTTNGGACSSKDIGLYSGLNSTVKKLVDAGSPADASTISDLPAGTIGSALYTHITVVSDSPVSSSDHVYVYLASTSTPSRYSANTAQTTQILYGYHTATTSRTCANLASGINKNAGALKTWLVNNQGVADPALRDKCPDGSTQAADGSCPSTSQSSCAIDGIGWILCPILTAGAGLADGAYKFLSDNFLATDPSLVNTDPNATTADGKLIGTGTYTAWKIMQGIGNVAFIIAVLIIIFSQLTGLGISNYGVKKLLPRVLVAAILVNLSFLLCQVAVDVSNILGFSLKGLLEGVAAQVTNAGGGTAAPTGDDSGNLVGIAASVLIIGSAAWINIGALIVAVVGAIVALLTIFLLLIVRKVLIVLLIVVAPLAFVAYLLPNTEPLFQRWRKMLTGLLLLFPIIGVLYGACLLASAVLLQVAGDDPVLKIAAYMALVIPLIAAIPLLKGSLDGIGKLGGAIQSFGQKARGVAQGGAKGSYDRSRLGQFKKYREGENVRRRALVQSGQFRGSNANPRNWFRNPASKVNQGINAVTGQFGDRATAEGISLANKAEAEAVGFQEQALRRQGISNPDAAKIALDKAVRSGDAVAAKAAQNILFTQGAAGMNAFHSTIVAAEADGHLNSNAASALRENINANHGQMVKTKAADISKWAALGGSLQGHTQSEDSWAGMSQSDLAGQTGDSLKRGADAGGIDAQAAADLLNNPQLNGSLDDKQTAALRQAAGEVSSSGSGRSPGTSGAGPMGSDVTNLGHSPNGPDDLDIPRT